MSRAPKEGLRVARLMMVLSSLSPLFLLWGVRGLPILPEKWFIAVCFSLILFPNLALYIRIRIAKTRSDTKILKVGTADDHRDHLLVYLFAVLLPFWTANLSSIRELAATLTAFAFIVFLFWHLNLHYMNVLFAIFGFRVFTITPPEDGNPISGRDRIVLITKRSHLERGSEIKSLRLSNTVYFEPEEM